MRRLSRGDVLRGAGSGLLLGGLVALLGLRRASGSAANPDYPGTLGWATYTLAPANSTPEWKRSASLVCNGDPLYDWEQFMTLWDAMPGGDALGGGLLAVGPGSITTSKSLQQPVDKRLVLWGQGTRSTHLVAAPGLNAPLLQLDKIVRHCRLYEVRLDGNRGQQTVAHPILLLNCPDFRAQNVLFQGSLGPTVRIAAASSNVLWSIIFQGCWFEWGREGGVHVTAQGYGTELVAFESCYWSGGDAAKGKDQKVHLLLDDSMPDGAHRASVIQVNGGQLKLSVGPAVEVAGRMGVSIVGAHIFDCGYGGLAQGADAVVFRRNGNTDAINGIVQACQIGSMNESGTRYAVSLRDGTRAVTVMGNQLLQRGGPLLGFLDPASTQLGNIILGNPA